MNEVSASKPIATPVAARPASSTGAVDAKAQPGESGKTLPNDLGVKAAQAADKAKEPSPMDSKDSVETAVAKINDYVQSIQRDLQFTVDEDLDRTVIKVVDGSSGELIRQIPEEVFLELARKLNDDGELRLMNALG